MDVSRGRKFPLLFLQSNIVICKKITVESFSFLERAPKRKDTLHQVSKLTGIRDCYPTGLWRAFG